MPGSPGSLPCGLAVPDERHAAQPRSWVKHGTEVGSGCPPDDLVQEGEVHAAHQLAVGIGQPVEGAVAEPDAPVLVVEGFVAPFGQDLLHERQRGFGRLASAAALDLGGELAPQSAGRLLQGGAGGTRRVRLHGLGQEPGREFVVPGREADGNWREDRL